MDLGKKLENSGILMVGGSHDECTDINRRDAKLDDYRIGHYANASR